MKPLYLFTVLTVFILVETKKLSIASVSTLNSQPGDSYLYGSIMGGTILYIKGTGFNPNPSMNQVFVGDYPCIVPNQGIKEETLTCTTSLNYPYNQYQLPIIVISNKQKVTASERFLYSPAHTPVLQEVYPSHSYANQQLRFISRNFYYGLAKVQELSIGNTTCGWDAISQKSSLSSEESQWNQRITCNQPPNLQGGKYSVNQQVSYGYTQKQLGFSKTSLSKQKYEHIIFPTISSISPINGSVVGQQITITGTGFPASNNLKKNLQVTLDNTECQIVQTSTNEIKCNLKKRSINSSSRIQNSINNTNYTYLSGFGFKYSLFNYTDTLQTFLQYESNSSQPLVPYKSGVKGQLHSINYDGQLAVETYQGYFFAPNTGNYSFIVESMQQLLLYFNQNPGVPSINKSTDKFITVSTYNFKQNPLYHIGTSYYKQIHLEGGKYYFMKVYFQKTYLMSQFKVYAQVPNDNKDLGWKTTQIQSVVLNYTNQPLIYKIRSFGATSGSINISLLIPNPNNIMEAQVNISKMIPYNASSWEICEVIYSIQYQFYIYYNYPKCQVSYLDKNQIELPFNVSKDKIFGYEWTIQFQKAFIDKSREIIDIPIENITATYSSVNSSSGGAPRFSIRKIQDSYPGINGTFQIISNGTYVNYSSYSFDFPYYISSYQLQSALRLFYNDQQLVVTDSYVDFDWTGQSGKNWTILYYCADSEFPALSFVTDNLAGGKSGTTPQIYFSNVTNFTNNLFYNPLSFELMRTVSSKPSFNVTVNSISSICLSSSCQFTYIDSAPTIVSLQMNQTFVVMNLSGSALKNSSIVKVKINEEDLCQDIKFPTNSSIVCNYYKNENNFSLIQAGSYYPNVYLEEIGYLEYQENVSALIFSFQLGNPSPPSGSELGNFSITLKGKGLPKNLSDISIQICNITALISSINSSSITIIAPQIKTQFSSNNLSCSITVLYPKNDINQTFGNFTYEKQLNFPILTNLSRNQSNPTKKGLIQIFGSGFDINNQTNKSNVNVFLKGINIDKTYRLRVLDLNDTWIKAGLSGGLTGSYKVQVEIIGKGLAKVANESSIHFYYGNNITSIEPTNGSYFGGQEIQINGNYFSPDINENQVKVGTSICAVTYASQNLVKCITGPKGDNQNQTVSVVVTSRQISNSICQGQCTFTYMSVSQSSMVYSSMENGIFQVNQQFSIIGNNFLKENSSVQIIAIHKVTNSKIIIDHKMYNNTCVVGQITKSIPEGDYYMFVNVKNVGYSNFTIFHVYAYISSVTNSLSTQGGIVNISGFGFPEISEFNLEIIDFHSRALLQLQLISVTSDLVQFQVPSRKLNGKLQIHTKYQTIYVVEFLDSLTPKAQISSNKEVQWKNSDLIVLSITEGVNYVPQKVTLQSILHPNVQLSANWTLNGSQVTIQNNLQPGTYKFKIFNKDAGFYQVNDTITILMPNISDTFRFNASNLSVEGGYILVQNTNLLPISFGQHSSLLVNGQKTNVTIINQTFFKLSYPDFIRSNKKYIQELSNTTLQSSQLQKLNDLDESKQKKNQNIDLSSYTKWSDSLQSDLTNSVFDSFTKTAYISSNSSCQIGIYFGEKYEIEISGIKFYPNKSWQKPGDFLNGGMFQGSSDNITWSRISTLDIKIERGWNQINIMKEDRLSFRYFRFIHNSTSNCSIGELELKGTKINNKIFNSSLVTSNNLTDHSVLISYSDGSTNYIWNDTVFIYSDKQTPVISQTTPQRGNVKGGQNITLTGTNLRSRTLQVIIDDTVCQIKQSNDTTIICQTSPRLQTPKRINFNVFVNGKNALIKQGFKYVYRWSDENTWGVDLPPVDGDLIYIPSNMHLFIDQSTPNLTGIIAENSTVQISDQQDIDINTANIILMRATLLAGTAQTPYQHKLTFNFYGTENDNQIPFFGNKGIGCTNCKVILHGSEKQAWTRVNSILQGSNNVTSIYPQPKNWEIGDEIVVSSTSFDYLESEKLTISNINKSSRFLDFQTKQNFQYNHVTSFETTKTLNQVFLGTEIGSLTRNIKLQGDSGSDITEHGIHLTLIGEQDLGLEVQVSNVEFKNCGQPKNSRHCINFNRNLDLPSSYIKNSTASNTYAKFISVSSTNLLNLSSNVGYRVKGHNIELKDGTQENNIIDSNLMISSLPYYRDLQTDVMVASYYISNPNNVITNNVAAGSYFYGFLYDLKVQSGDGIYAKDPVCTSGYQTGLNKGNVVHSISKIGVRITDLVTRSFPCKPSRNDSFPDPWSINPSRESLFEDYVIYHVQQLGLMCDNIGHVRFNNFTMAENNMSHMKFHIMNFTKENVVVSNTTFIGTLNLTNPSDIKTKALVLPRSGSINVTNILFKKYVENQTLVQTCSLCDQNDYYTNNGQEYFFDKVKYENMTNVTYLQMLGMEREIIYDNDGTFTSMVFDNHIRTSATVVKGYQHILSEPGCNLPSNQTSWDGSAVCGSNITIRKVTFLNAPNSQFMYYLPYLSRISSDPNATLIQQQLSSSSLYQYSSNMEIINSWSAPFVTGSKYQIRFGFQIQHFDVLNSRLMSLNDKGIIFKLAYNTTTELFDVYKVKNLQRSENVIISSDTNNLNPSTCQNGDSYHNRTIRDFQFCASGKNSSLYELIDITRVYCRKTCQDYSSNQTSSNNDSNSSSPPPVITNSNICIKQNFVRTWSNQSQWPFNRLPVQGQNVTIHCNWTVLLDVDLEPIAQLIIDGTLIVPQDRQFVNVTAHSIWVRKGQWLIGNQTNPFDQKMVIQLNGKPDDFGYAVDAGYGAKKNLLVTGRLQIYGSTDFDQSTFLNSDVQPGSNIITVNSSYGWNVGDQIILSTSSRSWNQSEKVKIQSMNGLQITISPALQFFHYQRSSNPSFAYQDTSSYTATKVIYVSRKIKILSAGSVDSFGFSLFVSYYIDNTSTMHMGSIALQGVQLSNGGQGPTFPVLAFKNTYNSTQDSFISFCSFVKCNSECVKFDNAKNLTFQNNVLYDSIRSHIRAIQLRQSKISENIMIKSRKNLDSLQNISVCLENRDMISTPYADNLTIFSNQCYGSQDVGFILPYLPCQKNDWKLGNNIARGCLTGFFMVKLPYERSNCLICDSQMAFNCKYGILGNPENVVNLTYNRLILIGNQQGLILRFTSKEKNNTAYVANSFLSPISNPNCASCNSIAQDCSNAVGIRLLSVTEAGPGAKIAFNSTQIKSPSPLDAKALILNSQFSHFKSNYSSIQSLSRCQNNFIFKAHDQAIDLVGSAYLHNTSSVQNDNTSLVYFRPFDLKFLGLQGGCGEFNCTSLQNYFIQDFSGDFLGSKGSKALPNNLYFSNKTVGCEFKQAINGYFCNETEQVSILQFQSIARDYNTRIVWPISLISCNGDTINNTLNVEKQWSYRNEYPEGKRIARLSSLIKLNTTYNLTFFNRPPADMIFQIQQKSPTVQNFAWIKLVMEYPDQNSIRVNANGIDMNPIVLQENQTQDLSLNVCGSYKFVNTQKYVEFILTTDCKVRMSFVNSIKATVKLDQAVSNFFTNNGTGKFIDKICLILGITDTSRLKIVGVYSGSTIIDFYIEDEQKTNENNATLAPSSSESTATMQLLSQKLDQAVSNGNLQTELTSAGLGSVLAVTSTIILVNETGLFQTDQSQQQQDLILPDNNDTQSQPQTNESSNKQKTIIIAVVVPVVSVIIILIALIIWLKFYKKSSTAKDANATESIKIIQQDNEIHIGFDYKTKQNLQNVKKSSQHINLKFMDIENVSVLTLQDPSNQHDGPQKAVNKQILISMQPSKLKLTTDK